MNPFLLIRRECGQTSPRPNDFSSLLDEPVWFWMGRSKLACDGSRSKHERAEDDRNETGGAGGFVARAEGIDRAGRSGACLGKRREFLLSEGPGSSSGQESALFDRFPIETKSETLNSPVDDQHRTHVVLFNS